MIIPTTIIQSPPVSGVDTPPTEGSRARRAAAAVARTFSRSPRANSREAQLQADRQAQLERRQADLELRHSSPKSKKRLGFRLEAGGKAEVQPTKLRPRAGLAAVPEEQPFNMRTELQRRQREKELNLRPRAKTPPRDRGA